MFYNYVPLTVLDRFLVFEELHIIAYPSRYIHNIEQLNSFYGKFESKHLFYTPVSRRVVLCDWVWRADGRPLRFPHNNFSSVYWIFTKLGHMIPLWKGKNPIYFGVIRSKVKITVTINRIFDNRVVSA